MVLLMTGVRRARFKHLVLPRMYSVILSKLLYLHSTQFHASNIRQQDVAPLLDCCEDIESLIIAQWWNQSGTKDWKNCSLSEICFHWTVVTELIRERDHGPPASCRSTQLNQTLPCPLGQATPVGNFQDFLCNILTSRFLCKSTTINTFMF